MLRATCLTLLALLGGCAQPVPIPVEPRPAPPLAIRIPPGCDLALTGDWLHQDDPTFRYRIEDDRTDVTVWVYRVFAPMGVDAGSQPRLLPAAVIHLRRTSDGFVGESELRHLLASGRECRATFATRVTACTPSTLTLNSATSTPVGEGCQTPSLPQPAAMLEHRLARTDAGAL